MNTHPRFKVETGKDSTGNILNVDNFESVIAKYGCSSMDFITGDGGFDFSNDYSKQEIQIAELLFAQIAFAIAFKRKMDSLC